MKSNTVTFSNSHYSAQFLSLDVRLQGTDYIQYSLCAKLRGHFSTGSGHKALLDRAALGYLTLKTLLEMLLSGIQIAISEQCSQHVLERSLRLE